MSADNLKLWNAVEKTNPAHTKKVTFGRAITAIDPYHQLKNATAQFGMAGDGWGWSVVQTMLLPTNELGILIRVWHGDPDKWIEQWGQSSFYIDNKELKKDTDCFKKATTDGLTKCLSMLGFNADVFLGKFEDNKYVQSLNEEFASERELNANDLAWINAIKSGKSTLEQIEDIKYRDFIKQQVDKEQ